MGLVDVSAGAAMLDLRSFGAVILICFVVRIIVRRYWTPIADIPGPILASFSALWQVYHLWKGHIEEELISLHKKHGYFIRIGENEVSVSHTDAVKQLLHANIAKGSWYSIFSMPDYNYVNQMSELNPRRHIEKYRNIAAGFALSNIIKFEPHVDAVLQNLEEHLDKFCDSGESVEFDKWFSFFAFDVLGEVTFSKSFGFIETGTDVRNAVENTKALALYVAAMGHYVWFHNLTLGNPLLSRIGIQPSSHIFDTCLAAIDERKRNPEIRNDMMQRWLDVRAKYPDRMAENELLAAAVGNVGAGADTVGATAQALIYYLLRHPEYLRRVREEIDTAQSRGEISPMVQYNEAQKLPFLQACLKETYRYHSAVVGGLPRVVPPGGMTIGGRYFPEGIVLSINTWVFHRNPEIFGEDCDSFKPDRWFQKDTTNIDSFLIHWGAGYNQCPGRNLAQFELSKLLTTLIRDYDIELVDSTKEWVFKSQFLAVPAGWPCKIRRRMRK